MSRKRAAIALSIATSALSLCACSGGTASTSGSLVRAPNIAVPLSTSVETGAGTWATIPMGQLDQPLNTFWQLFFLPAGGSTWSDQVEATAVATNGGLVLAASAEGVVVGVEPSNDLTYSPLIASSDGGSTWSNGLLTEGLVERPQALAYGGDGRALALVKGSGNDQTKVLQSSEGLSIWRTLTSTSSLAAAPGARSCEPGELTAVTFLAVGPVLGASCSRPGVVGIFTEHAGSWDLVGPNLPSSLERGRAEVLSMTSSANTLTALVGISDGTVTDLVAAWSADGGQDWSTSSVLPMSGGSQLASVGPAGSDAWSVLVDDATGARTLDVVDGPGTSWTTLRSPPAATATVVFPPGAAPEALVVDGATLRVWDLDQESNSWTEGQRMNVPIQYGSSN